MFLSTVSATTCGSYLLNSSSPEPRSRMIDQVLKSVENLSVHKKLSGALVSLVVTFFCAFGSQRFPQSWRAVFSGDFRRDPKRMPLPLAPRSLSQFTSPFLTTQTTPSNRSSGYRVAPNVFDNVFRISLCGTQSRAHCVSGEKSLSTLHVEPTPRSGRRPAGPAAGPAHVGQALLASRLTDLCKYCIVRLRALSQETYSHKWFGYLIEGTSDPGRNNALVLQAQGASASQTRHHNWDAHLPTLYIPLQWCFWCSTEINSMAISPADFDL